MLRCFLLIMAVIIGSGAQAVGDACDSIVVPQKAYSHERMEADLELLKSRYSVILSGGVIGKSVEGRRIPAVRLGRGRHTILVCGALHAREYITTNYLMYFIEQYARAYTAHDSIGGYDVNRLLDYASF